MKKLAIYSIPIVLVLMLSCSHQEKSSESVLQSKPIVSIIHPTFGEISIKEQLNGQIVYLNKTTINAPITGYITVVKIKIGDLVKKGELLFKIQTLESKALEKENTSSTNNIGIISVYASASGIINSLSITEPDVFTSAGNTMATIIKNSDILVQANVPFEYNQKLIHSKQIEIVLSDNTVLPAVFYKELPNVDQISQTQQILLKLLNYKSLPENLNVDINFQTKGKVNTILIPKDALLTNETQDKFWIMKVTKDSMAVSITVTKGLSNSKEVEILNSGLALTDNIIIKGAYGLTDSTKVTVE